MDDRTEKTKKVQEQYGVKPKRIYLALFPMIGAMGLLSIYNWISGESNFFGLVIGLIFLVVSYVIFQQYKREQHYLE